MTYPEATEYLFNVAPSFQNVGKGAYKEGLSNTIALDEHFGHPHKKYKTIHVAGTNGKGSCSHTLAAILQSAGYRVGLYTSPHLVDFRERIRVNGQMIPEQRVIDFVEQERDFFEPLSPSFFELTTALAFKYFEEQKVDVAVIEVGLGGRLDCTNIITPELSIITNISFDHTQFLGSTLELIASEKAGIIKPKIPVIIGETNGHDGVKQVFVNKAKEQNSPILFADETNEVLSSKMISNGSRMYETKSFGSLQGQLGGLCQEKNTATVLCALRQLQRVFKISEENVRNGFANVCSLTGLMGRWQRIQSNPTAICDTGHNPGGLAYIGKQLHSYVCKHLHIVVGMVADKDVKGSLQFLPKDATYYFTQPSVKRAMDAHNIAELGKELGMRGQTYDSVSLAYQAALQNAESDDLVFVGGSSYIVADFLSSLSN